MYTYIYIYIYLHTRVYVANDSTKKGCNKGRSDGAVEGVCVVPMTHACTYTFVSTHAYIYLYMYICMYIFIHAYLYICAYLHDVVKRKER
jgi:hypothetical protein